MTFHRLAKSVLVQTECGPTFIAAGTWVEANWLKKVILVETDALVQGRSNVDDLLLLGPEVCNESPETA